MLVEDVDLVMATVGRRPAVHDERLPAVTLLHEVNLESQADQARQQLGSRGVVVKTPQMSALTMELNSGRKPWGDPRVRQAASMAIDRKEAMQVMTDGAGEVVAAAQALWEPAGTYLNTASFGLPPRPAAKPASWTRAATAALLPDRLVLGDRDAGIDARLGVGVDGELGAGLKVGLLINFGALSLRAGLKRIIV